MITKRVASRAILAALMSVGNLVTPVVAQQSVLSGGVYASAAMSRSCALVVLGAVALGLAQPARAGWSYAPWTDDANSGISNAYPYTVAVNLNGPAVTVNGVTFEAQPLDYPWSGANYKIEGATSGFGGGSPNISGNSFTLATDFQYDSPPYTVTLRNLTPGKTYETTFFSYGFESGGRTVTFSSDGESSVIDQDAYGEGSGIRILYTFVASADTKVITITPTAGTIGHFHFCALANRWMAPPAAIIGFGTNVAGSSAVINAPSGGAAAIAWTVPYGTVLAPLAPTYSLSSGTGTPASGSLPSPNFSAGPVTYTVTAGGVTNVYAVTVTIAPPSTACNLLTFNANLAGSRATVMSTGTNTGTLVVNVPAGTTNPQLAALTPTCTLSLGATCVTPTPPLSLTGPVHYIVTAQDGITTKDYTATVATNAEAFRLFVVKTATNGLASSDYDYLTVVPASRHRNAGVPAVFAVASTNDFTGNIYLQDYLRRYRPSTINTINFTASVPDFTSAAINAVGPLELSVYLATNFWTSSSKVVLVSDEVATNNYPNVLQASALAAALNAPLLYYNSNSAKVTPVTNAIARLGATEVVYVNAAGTMPGMATRVVTNPATVLGYLAEKNITVDYFATTNPKDLNLISGAKLSLTAPFIAARRAGIVVPVTSYTPVPNSTEMFHFTGYPAIKAELQQLYQAIGRYPSYLALVGNATSIPLGYRIPNEHVGDYYGSPADLDYAEVDTDVFPDIAIGRIMAYDIFDATLLTSRISTYEQLFDGVWEKTMADVGGQWNNADRDALGANYGFGSTNLVGSLRATQPVEAAIIGHHDHSSYHELGGAFSVGSVNVLAPAAIFSGGCGTAAIDFETISEDYDPSTGWANTDRGLGLLVVNRLFKLGAVAFVGATRLDTGSGKIKASAMVNALFAGETLGRGYMAGMDVMSWNGADDQRWNWIFLGDPGLQIHVPSAPVVTPASHAVTAVTTNTETLTVTVPATLFATEVDPTWCSHWGLTYPEYWGDKAGLYGMDVDRFYLIRQTITRPVVSVEELDVWPIVNIWVQGDGKLGMLGQPTVDYRPDGTAQLVWALRANVMDWPSSQSKVPLTTMTTATFRITYDLVPDITSFNANLAGSSVTIQSLSDTNGTVVVYVPQGTTDAQIAALAPTYTLDFNATCNQTNNAAPTPPLSTATPVAYVVSPGAGSSQPPKVYSVTVVRSPFTYAAWTGDADSGLSNTSPYTVAVNLAGSAVAVNGVTFEDQPQNYPWSGTNYTIEGNTSGFNGASPNLTGNSFTLGGDFLYDNPPCTVTLLNLTPGNTYETTFFSFGWGDGARLESFVSGGDSRVIDQNVYGNGNGIRIMYRFVAGASTKVIAISPSGGDSFHFCALANRQVVGVPAVPAGLSVVDSNAVVNLKWSTVSGATSYDVKRATVSGGPYTTVQWLTATNFTDTAVNIGTTYYYVVSALNAVGEGANSMQVSATPVDLVLSAILCGCTNLLFAWSGTGFRLQMRTNLMVGDWWDYPGGNLCPVSVPLTNDCGFFRVVQ